MGAVGRAASVRIALGTPRARVAAWARCSEGSVAMFEANRETVGEEIRARLDRVYLELRTCLARLEAPHG